MRPLLRFRLFGIPVHVQGWFLLTAAVFGLGSGTLTGGLLWMAVAAASVLWHELGHALAMRAFGHPPWIELVAMGGLTHWPEASDPSPRQALIVSAAGPGAQLALAGALWLWLRHGPDLPPGAAAVVHLLLAVNVGWALFNLLPIMPLDGSHICEHASRMVNGVREPRWVGWLSLVTGGALGVWGLAAGSVWIGFIGAMGAMAGLQRVRAGGRGGAPGGLAVARRRAAAAGARGDLGGVARALLPAARVGALGEADLAQLVGAMVRTGAEAALVELVELRLRSFHRRADAAPLAQLALEGLGAAGAHEEAAAVAQLAFRQLGAARYAHDAAGHLAQLGRLDEALEWLARGVDAGLEGGGLMLSDPTLAPLRDHPGFVALAARAGARPGTA